MSKLKFCLDMDGVCCDWVSAALRTLGREEFIDNWTPGIKGIEALTGKPKSIFWTELESQGSQWWRDLEEYTWFRELYDLLASEGDVVFCTSPNLDPSSLKGKVGWIQDRFDKFFRDYIITNQKYHVAGPNTVLVDDNDKQCANFKKHGGEYILFPQLWNDTHLDADAQQNKIKYVQNKIKEIKENKGF